MRSAAPNHRALAFLLAGLCLLVVVVIALEARYPFQLEQEERVAPANPNLADLVPTQERGEEIALPPLGNYEEIVARPLFRPSRRPPDPEKAAAEEARKKAMEEAERLKSHVKDLFILSGVVVTAEKTVALLQDIKNNKSLRVSEGERLEGWKVQQIFPNRVLFRDDGRSEALELIRNFEATERKPPRRRRAVRRSNHR
ncbi:pilus assembly protein PilZ [Nitrosococcus oceani]|uniref:pilus assembly protein PilZ n=1 Tax=Nitrosococcus oceani TaxID=1229 RepID=UPI0004E88A13|nr:pilus assembly protein PilZ [Nitrosococcus oceani]KFI23351.1 pilus assembly protein PilZ [Nitrosococcus oceani]